MSIYESAYPELAAGGFTRLDGTVQFYGRVNALLHKDMVVLDFGAGRGVAAQADSSYRRSLMVLSTKVRRVIGVDVDDAVLENPFLDETAILDGPVLPLGDESVDLIVSDHVFEHIQDPAAVSGELQRVLKPGGWLCARTPSAYSLMVLVSRLLPNRYHARAVMRIQPSGHREERDVFPTVYALNTMAALRRHFPECSWEHLSYTWSPEPAYHMGSRAVLRILMIYQWLKRPFCGEVLYIFLRKKPTLGKAEAAAS